MKEQSVLFVCLGNICRSPTAEGVFQKKVEEAGLEHVISIDSAGTSNWHVGDAPDSRTVEAAKSRGYKLSHLRGRQVQQLDFDNFDYILAMDENNLMDLKSIAPRDYPGHLGLFLGFSKQSKSTEVPDPYHGGAKGFDLVLDLVEDGCDGLLEDMKSQ